MMAINAKQAAEIEIAAILKRLEVETGKAVSSLDLNRLELMVINGNEDGFVKVAISLDRVPGQGWIAND